MIASHTTCASIRKWTDLSHFLRSQKYFLQILSFVQNQGFIDYEKLEPYGSAYIHGILQNNYYCTSM